MIPQTPRKSKPLTHFADNKSQNLLLYDASSSSSGWEGKNSPALSGGGRLEDLYVGRERPNLALLHYLNGDGGSVGA